MDSRIITGYEPNKEVLGFMKNSTCKISVAADGKLLSTSIVPAIRGYEAVNSLSYNYDSDSDRTSLEISASHKIKDLGRLIASVLHYGNPEGSHVDVTFRVLPKNNWLLRRLTRCRIG